MIERYSSPEMTELWSEKSKFQAWLDVEIAVSEVLAEMGQVPAAAVKVIKEKASFTVERIKEIEEVTRHDVIAFTTAVAENVGLNPDGFTWGLLQRTWLIPPRL